MGSDPPRTSTQLDVTHGPQGEAEAFYAGHERTLEGEEPRFLAPTTVMHLLVVLSRAGLDTFPCRMLLRQLWIIALNGVFRVSSVSADRVTTRLTCATCLAVARGNPPSLS